MHLHLALPGVHLQFHELHLPDPGRRPVAILAPSYVTDLHSFALRMIFARKIPGAVLV